MHGLETQEHILAFLDYSLILCTNFRGRVKELTNINLKVNLEKTIINVKMFQGKLLFPRHLKTCCLLKDRKRAIKMFLNPTKSDLKWSYMKVHL